MGVLGAIFFSAVVMFVLFRQLDPRYFVVLAFAWGAGEVFVKIRWRMSVLCKVCHFDPIIYVKNPDQAAEKVRLRLEERSQDPQYLLARPLDLPKIDAKKAKVLKEKGRGKLVSKTI